MALIPATDPLALEPSVRSKLWRGADDTLMATPRVVWSAWNIVANTYLSGRNLLTRARGYTATAAADIVDSFTRNPYEYLAYEKVLRQDPFMGRWKKRFGNLWTGIKNGGRFTANTFKKAVIAPIKTGIYTLPIWATSMTIGNSLQTVKDLSHTVHGWVVDTADAVLTIGDQWKDKKWYGYTQVQNPEVASYESAQAKIVQDRQDAKARKVAANERKIARLQAQNDQLRSAA